MCIWIETMKTLLTFVHGQLSTLCGFVVPQNLGKQCVIQLYGLPGYKLYSLPRNLSNTRPNMIKMFNEDPYVVFVSGEFMFDIILSINDVIQETDKFILLEDNNILEILKRDTRTHPYDRFLPAINPLVQEHGGQGHPLFTGHTFTLSQLCFYMNIVYPGERWTIKLVSCMEFNEVGNIYKFEIPPCPYINELFGIWEKDPSLSQTFDYYLSGPNLESFLERLTQNTPNIKPPKNILGEYTYYQRYQSIYQYMQPDPLNPISLHTQFIEVNDRFAPKVYEWVRTKLISSENRVTFDYETFTDPDQNKCIVIPVVYIIHFDKDYNYTYIQYHITPLEAVFYDKHGKVTTKLDNVSEDLNEKILHNESEFRKFNSQPTFKNVVVTPWNATQGVPQGPLIHYLVRGHTMCNTWNGPQYAYLHPTSDELSIKSRLSSSRKIRTHTPMEQKMVGRKKITGLEIYTRAYTTLTQLLNKQGGTLKNAHMIEEIENSLRDECTFDVVVIPYHLVCYLWNQDVEDYAHIFNTKYGDSIKDKINLLANFLVVILKFSHILGTRL